MRAYRDQHFLTDSDAVSRIADILDISGKTVLEIGPGKGVLTRSLLDRGAEVVAVELDPILVKELTGTFSKEIELGRLSIIPGDATKVALPSFTYVIANLPYSISSPITFRLLEIGFESAILMYQKEFADRMMAPIGSRDCGRLSVMVQTYARARGVFDLPPSSFSPPPEVWSTVVWIEPRSPLFPIHDHKVYADLVRVLFTRRRKTVRSILKGTKGVFSNEAIECLLSSLDPEILASRPEALYLEDYATITNLITSQ